MSATMSTSALCSCRAAASSSQSSARGTWPPADDGIPNQSSSCGAPFTRGDCPFGWTYRCLSKAVSRAPMSYSRALVSRCLSTAASGTAALITRGVRSRTLNTGTRRSTRIGVATKNNGQDLKRLGGPSSAFGSTTQSNGPRKLSSQPSVSLTSEVPRLKTRQRPLYGPRRHLSRGRLPARHGRDALTPSPIQF